MPDAKFTKELCLISDMEFELVFVFELTSVKGITCRPFMTWGNELIVPTALATGGAVAWPLTSVKEMGSAAGDEASLLRLGTFVVFSVPTETIEPELPDFGPPLGIREVAMGPDMQSLGLFVDCAADVRPARLPLRLLGSFELSRSERCLLSSSSESCG